MRRGEILVERETVAALVAEGADMKQVAERMGMPSLWHAYTALQRYARYEYGLAKKEGRIQSAGACQDCGSGGRIHGHHPDYTKPLDVEWLCPLCHRRRHRGPRMSRGTPRQEFECWIGPTEAALLLGVSHEQLRRLVKREGLPHTRLSRNTFRYLPSALEAWKRFRSAA